MSQIGNSKAINDSQIGIITQLAKKGSATVSKGKRMLLFLIQWYLLNKILGRFICVGIGQVSRSVAQRSIYYCSRKGSVTVALG